MVPDYNNGSFDNLDIGGGIRIKINKEKRVLNHLSSQPENTNLLFYNFNAYNENDNIENRERVPTRGVKSRKDFRERQIQSAACARNQTASGASTATNTINQPTHGSCERQEEPPQPTPQQEFEE